MHDKAENPAPEQKKYGKVNVTTRKWVVRDDGTRMPYAPELLPSFVPDDQA